ncbi:HAD-IA family hydrolase [Zooshikella sp. RANM57]|uniref:HAD-IA family hydrolase n=1 Tax=Zooshikella sp. RANM57 TaxID=3425863 RepID=UPI003D6E54A0
MHLNYHRKYCGKIQAVIFDMTGTLVDFGVKANGQALQQLFSHYQIQLSPDILLAIADLPDLAQLTYLFNMEDFKNQWQQHHGSLPDEKQLEQLIMQFRTHQIDYASQQLSLPVDSKPVFQFIRKQGYKVGVCTHYCRDIASDLIPQLTEQGLKIDHWVSAVDVSQPRPAPHLVLTCAVALDIMSVAACVKVDDSLKGIEEGLNAGMWTIGTAISGEYNNRSMSEWNQLSNTEKDKIRSEATLGLYRAGAHYVVDTVSDIQSCLEDIEARLKRGERP